MANEISIRDINIYRDGGSIAFVIDDGTISRHVWLNRPEEDGTRELLLDKLRVENPLMIRQIIAEIDRWWRALSHSLQEQVLKELTPRNGPRFNPTADQMHASKLSLVVSVQRFLELDLASKERGLGTLKEYYLRVIADDDSLNTEDIERLFLVLVKGVPGAAITMLPRPHGRGGFSIRLLLPSGSIDDLARFLDANGLHFVL